MRHPILGNNLTSKLNNAKKTLKMEKIACAKIVSFRDWLLTAIHPIPPHDSSSKEREQKKISTDACHLSALDARVTTNVTNEIAHKSNCSD